MTVITQSAKVKTQNYKSNPKAEETVVTVITQSAKVKTQNYKSNPKADLKSRTYDFSLEVIRSTSGLAYTISNDVIVKQLIRSATSVGANIVEAKSSSSRKDFINYFTHALKSANETKYWLCLLRDACCAGGDKINHLISEITEIANMPGASVLTLKTQNSKCKTQNYNGKN